jgi:hypothetical protein
VLLARRSDQQRLQYFRPAAVIPGAVECAARGALRFPLEAA